MSNSAPTRIGKYDIIEVLGRGGMGVVYKAKDPHLGRLVAIKMTACVGDSEELVSRFFREAQSTASLQHPNIVTVYELGDCGGNPYLVMEYLEGQSLDVIIGGNRPLNLLDELDIMLDVCRGLDYAHQSKIIHRDIKPANIVVLKDGGVKLVDFGIAHIVGRKLTQPGQVIGSFNYMSPEQINSKAIDTRTDIFSAGIVLYQLLTKALPFQAENTAATLMKIVHEPPPPLAQFLNVYPPELETILLRALAKDREERYQTIEEFAADLRGVREQVRQETINRHLLDASALIEANALSKAREEVFQALKWDPHHSRAGQLMREIQLRIEGRPVAREATADSREHLSQESIQSEPATPGRKEADSARPSRLQECLQEARQEIDFRRFASALEILKEAQSLDPDAPQVNELVRSATVARETERKAQELTALRSEIRAAIQWKDYAGAVEQTAAALAKFPGDPGLLELQQVLEKERSVAERHNNINQELTSAQKLLEQGREDEVITLLSQALHKFGQDTRLDSLLRFARENAERKKLEKRKNDVLQAAREQITRKDYSAAIRILEAVRADLEDKAEIEDLLQHVSDLAGAEHRKTAIASAADRARSLLGARAYADAIKLLESTLAEIPNEEMEILLVQARKGAAAHRRKLQDLLESAENLLRDHKPDEALNIIEAESSYFYSEPNWRSLRERAQREAVAKQEVQQAISEARILVEAGQYDAARKRLVECKGRVTGSTEIDQELAHIQQLRVAENSKLLAKAMEEAIKLNDAREYESALDKLAAVAKFLPDVPATLRSKYEDAQKMATDAILQRARAEIQAYIAAGQLTKAQESLSRTSTNLAVFRALADLESAVSDEIKRRAGVQRALDEARRFMQRNQWQQAAELVRRELALPIRVLQLKEDLIAEFFHAAELSLNTGWRSCEQLLKQFRDLEPQHQIPPPLLTRMADLRREEAVSACLDQARLLQMKGDLQGARRGVAQLAATHPHDARLAEFCQRADLQIAQNEEKARQEQEHREQEMSVANAIRRADAETSLDLRASILGEAQRKYPQDSRLQPQLNHLKELSQRVSEMAQAARAREHAGEYEIALAKWEALRITYRHYPELEQHIERVKKLRDEARVLARRKWISNIRDKIAASNYDEASSLLSQATAEFPWDDEFMSLQSNVEGAIKARNKAQKHLASAQQAFARQKWEAGRKAAIKACQAAKEDRLVWHQAVRELMDACRVSRSQEPGFAASTVRLLSELGSAFDIPNGLLELGREPEERSASRHREVEGSSPADPKQPGPGWIGKVRHAISSLSGTEQKALRPLESEPETAPMPVPEVAQSFTPPAGSRPQMSAVESRPFWSGAALEREGASPSPKVIEFPTASEGLSRDARLSATDAFIPGAVAPPLPELFPSVPESNVDPIDTPVSAPSIVRSLPEIVSPSVASVPSRPDLRQGTNWPEETLRRIEKRLAAIVGPLARILVNRASAQTNNLEELLSLLTAKLPSESDRKAFLAAKSELLATPVAQVGLDRSNLSGNRTTLGVVNPDIDPQSLERAIHILAHYVGPIASVLVKRAATRARSVEELHRSLAERVEESKRAQFLKECGHVNES
jgi:serine/threonine-protein kinase